MRIFKKASSTTITNAASSTARKVEMAKNVLAIYGGVRLVADVWNAVRIARLIKSGKIVQGEDGYWYYTDTQSDTDEVEEGGDEEEAQ